MSDAPQNPPFPPLSGAGSLSDDEKQRIAEAAWKQSNQNPQAFEQLCAEHLRGEINLFGEEPQRISGDGSPLSRQAGVRSAANERARSTEPTAPSGGAVPAAGPLGAAEGAPLTPTQTNTGEPVETRGFTQPAVVEEATVVTEEPARRR